MTSQEKRQNEKSTLVIQGYTPTPKMNTMCTHRNKLLC